MDWKQLFFDKKILVNCLNCFHFLPPSLNVRAMQAGSSKRLKFSWQCWLCCIKLQSSYMVNKSWKCMLFTFFTDIKFWCKICDHYFLWWYNGRFLRLKLEILANIPAFSRPHLYLCICLKHFDLLLTCLVTIIVKAVIDGRQR